MKAGEDHFGTSLSVTLWNRREQYHHSYLVDPINEFNIHSLHALDVLSELGFKGLKGYIELDNIITHQAFMLATNDIFWLSAVAFLGLLAILWFTKPPFITKGAPITVAE